LEIGGSTRRGALSKGQKALKPQQRGQGGKEGEGNEGQAAQPGLISKQCTPTNIGGRKDKAGNAERKKHIDE